MEASLKRQKGSLMETTLFFIFIRDAFKKKTKKTEIWDIVSKGGRGSKPDPKFFTYFK